MEIILARVSWDLFQPAYRCFRLKIFCLNHASPTAACGAIYLSRISTLGLTRKGIEMKNP